ncbi:MAG: hypothetical protein WCV68_03585 [Candidatus Paceibacterota bacterium]|jgi:hypothetical protein
MLKGTIVENSLSDKEILNHLKIEKTYNSEDWILHDVWVEENQVAGLAKSLDSGPWYIHLWEPGKDEIIVIFKDKTFIIKQSDKSTWSETIAYGQSIGIPEEQLDFIVKE